MLEDWAEPVFGMRMACRSKLMINIRNPEFSPQLEHCLLTPAKIQLKGIFLCSMIKKKKKKGMLCESD